MGALMRWVGFSSHSNRERLRSRRGKGLRTAKCLWKGDSSCEEDGTDCRANRSLLEQPSRLTVLRKTGPVLPVLCGIQLPRAAMMPCEVCGRCGGVMPTMQE